MTTEAVAPGLALGTPFTDECSDDPDGKKVYTKLEKEQVWLLEHLIREGYARDMAGILRKIVNDWLDIKGALISSDLDYDATRRSWQMQQQMRFMLDRDHELEHLPDQICAALSKLLRHCDHDKLGQQITKLWNQAQASDEYWRRQYTAMFREKAILKTSVSVLHRVGWPLPGELVTHVLGHGASVAGSGAARSNGDPAGDAVGVGEVDERERADRGHHPSE